MPDEKKTTIEEAFRRQIRNVLEVPLTARSLGSVQRMAEAAKYFLMGRSGARASDERTFTFGSNVSTQPVIPAEDVPVGENPLAGSEQIAEVIRGELIAMVDGGDFTVERIDRLMRMGEAAKDFLAAHATKPEDLATYEKSGSDVVGIPSGFGLGAESPLTSGAAAETFGAKALDRLLAKLPEIWRLQSETPAAKIRALAEARASGMVPDVVAQLERELGVRPKEQEELPFGDGDEVICCLHTPACGSFTEHQTLLGVGMRITAEVAAEDRSKPVPSGEVAVYCSHEPECGSVTEHQTLLGMREVATEDLRAVADDRSEPADLDMRED